MVCTRCAYVGIVSCDDRGNGPLCRCTGVGIISCDDEPCWQNALSRRPAAPIQSGTLGGDEAHYRPDFTPLEPQSRFGDKLLEV